MKRKKQKALLRFLALFVFGLTFVMFVYYNVFRWPYDSLPFDVKSTIDAMGVEENDSVALPEIEKLGGDPSKTGNRSKSAFKQDVGACKIPKLEMNGSEVIKFYKKFAPLVCDRRKAEPWVFIDEQRRIRPTEFAKKIGLNKIKCLWSFYDRISDTKLEWTRREQFNFGDLVEKGDFFKVDCYTNDTKWSNPFMVVVPTADKVDRLKSVRAHATAGQTPLNVYILSFDSLSQMSFRRNLPKTTAFLENEMKSVVFNGYNIVGDGTPQAFIPILTGQTEEELPMTRKRYSNAHFVDEAYPFAWRNFSAAGYATMYGEDGHSFGTFTYRLKGFKEQPTGHYPITFFHYTETVESGHLCIGNEKQHNVWFRYIESFWREYSKLGIPRFSVMHHSYLSHDDLNRVQQVDDDLVAHLRRMGKMNAFENTLAIVMADHGARFSELRQTHQGQLEERLPFFSVHFPTSLDGISTELSKKALFNLKTNANNRLASPFDVHATLMDAIRWPLPLEYLNRPHSLDRWMFGVQSKSPKPAEAPTGVRERKAEKRQQCRQVKRKETAVQTDGTETAQLGAGGRREAMRFHCPLEGCRRRDDAQQHFASAKLLVQHFQKKHTEKRHRCSECSARFALARDLRYHQKKVCPNAKRAIRAETSIPKNSNLRLPTTTEATPNAAQSAVKVFLVPVKFDQRIRFRRIFPRLAAVERRTVATQTGDHRPQNVYSLRQQMAPQFCAESSPSSDTFYTETAAVGTPSQFAHQMHKNNLFGELLQFQNAHCQTNYQPKTTTIDFAAQWPSGAIPSGVNSFCSSSIYLPPLVTSSTQTAQMLHQCSQTIADDPPTATDGHNAKCSLLLQTQNSAATQTYAFSQRLPPFMGDGMDSTNCCWATAPLDEAALCSSVSAQTDASWANEMPRVG
uniref:DUF229 domain-containing protein n=1 Tax=Globodera pallida TaxID=36090 RepID=A0A183CHQ4_GLOPA